MFFVFHFLVFAYLTRSEINCFTQGNIRAKNYVREHEEISKLRDAAQIKEAILNTNKLNSNLKSNAFEQILTDEMLSVDHSHIPKDSSETPLLVSVKHHLVTPTLERKQKWPMFKYINKAKEAARKEQNTNLDTKMSFMEKIIKNDEDYLEPVPQSEVLMGSKFNVKKPFEAQQSDKIAGLKSDVRKSPKSNPGINEVVGKRRETSGSCNLCTGNHNIKRCTHSTPNVRAHECSRFGMTSSNHSCSMGPSFQGPQFLPQPFMGQQFIGQQYQNQPTIAPGPYSFYPVYLPYSYFASEAPGVPYKVSYPQPNLLSDLKIPRKHRCKNNKLSTRPEDYLYYEDNDSRERKAEDSEYYPDSKRGYKKESVLYDVNQDTLIKEIVKDLKIQNNNELVKECYCNSSLSTCRVNIVVLIITSLCFAMIRQFIFILN